MGSWEMATLAGAGGLRSTPGDMMRFLEANLNAEVTPLQDVLAHARELHGPFDDANAMGLGWLVSSTGVRWHNGQTYGHHAFIAFDPDEGWGLALLSNTASHQVTALGQAISKFLEGRQFNSLELPPKIVELPLEILKRYVGRYELAPGAEFTMTLKEGVLHAHLMDQRSLPIYPKSETRFFYRAGPASLEFEVSEEGDVTGLIFRQVETEAPARRLP